MNQSRDVHWMQHALKLAQCALQKGEVPVGALLVLGDSLVAEGYNSSISLHDPTAHAEILAIRKAGQTARNYRLPGMTLYVTLEPCPMCAGAMVHARIDRIVYGTPDPRTGAAGSVFNLVQATRTNHRLNVTGGVLKQECTALLKNFFRLRRK